MHYLVKNWMYSCEFPGPAGLDPSDGEMSKKTVRHVLLSRPHIFHDVVFPWPITVSATWAPFCKYCFNQEDNHVNHFIILKESMLMTWLDNDNVIYESNGNT